MQIKLSYAEAQQLIINVARQIAASGEDVVIDVPDTPDAWSTELPTAEGTYWTYAPGEPIYLMELELQSGRLTETISGLTPEDLPRITHWLGPLPVPELPSDKLTLIDPETGLPPGAIKMTGPDDDN